MAGLDMESGDQVCFVFGRRAFQKAKASTAACGPQGDSHLMKSAGADMKSCVPIPGTTESVNTLDPGQTIVIRAHQKQ